METKDAGNKVTKKQGPNWKSELGGLGRLLLCGVISGFGAALGGHLSSKMLKPISKTGNLLLLPNQKTGT